MIENRPSRESHEIHRGHETSDANVKPIVAFLVGLALFLILTMASMSWLMDFLQIPVEHVQQVPYRLKDSQQIPPVPRLQANPSLDLHELRVREERLLGSYEWVDENTGVMRIPIERAMEILAKQGLPSRGEYDAEGSEQ